MSKAMKNLPVRQARAYLEPGPIVLVSSAFDGVRNVMTMGWHTIMEFSPSLLGCVISRSNFSFDLIRRSGECVINLPTAEMIDLVVSVGNSSGRDVDKFEHLEIAVGEANLVGAPVLSACFGQFECRVADDALVDRYNFFVMEIVAARIAVRPRHPTTLHYTGDGVFLWSGKVVSRRADFRPALLGNGRGVDGTRQ
ncbi:flavin reductase family protein [Sphingomonas sp. AP4-R1]|uniref:flavin reductase family protein n=1 Tax=Sphingomonas sp. AP4-R1 TaxID=2735134 RepID=UPI001493CE47|nr:flavin reductase family protein [Sphingomonas sp. AP4-R1]QJU59252.1 flavin reductase family protein [Sphingomonas sp. AP4-R1]